MTDSPTEPPSVIISKLYRRDIAQIMVDQGGPVDPEGQRDIDYLLPVGVNRIVCNPGEVIEITVKRVRMK